MIFTDDAIRIQLVLIERFGGARGLRDKMALEAALMRLYQTFSGKDLYTSPAEKAAAIMESILINHPFIDGNKRFGYVAMRLILMDYDMDIGATEQDKYDFVLGVAKGELKFKQILNWINDRIA